MDNKLVIFEEEMAICYMLDRRKAKNAMNELSKKLPAGAMEKLKQEEIDLNLIISEAKVINFLPLIENKPYMLQYTLEGGDVKEQYIYHIFDQTVTVKMVPLPTYADLEDIGTTVTHNGRSLV